GRVDRVVVDDADGADTGRGQIQGSRGAEATGPDQEHPGPEEASLPGLSDLGQTDVMRVALQLLVGEVAAPIPRQAETPPGDDASTHRRGPVAHAVEGLGGEEGSIAGGAVRDHGRPGRHLAPDGAL